MYCVQNFVVLFLLLLFLFLSLPLFIVETLRAGLIRADLNHTNLKTQKIQGFLDVMLENEANALLGKYLPVNTA
jgi:hypothetical protein